MGRICRKVRTVGGTGGTDQNIELYGMNKMSLVEPFKFDSLMQCTLQEEGHINEGHGTAFGEPRHFARWGRRGHCPPEYLPPRRLLLV